MWPDDGLPHRAPDLPESLRRIARTYGRALERHGPTAGGVGWSTGGAQALRLRVLLRILDGETAPTVSVHDLGCGYGAAWPLLAALEAPRVAGYVGYDICPPMISRARALYGRDPRVRFLLGDSPVEDADYGLVSGTFNYRGGETEDAWQAYVHTSLETFAAACRKGLAFNLLHHRTAKRSSRMAYADPARMLAFAQSHLATPRGGTVTVVEDYLVDDFTVLVRFGG